MTEWKSYKLADVCSRLRSGKTISATSVSPNGKYAVIGGNGVRGYTEKSNFKGQCVVVGRQGAYCGNVRYFDGEFYMTEHAVVIVGNEYANTHYLAYLLSTMELGHLSAQSAQPGLSIQTLSKLEIYLPPLSQQQRIVNLLGALDHKIEINRRINDNLEQQAQALYKSWFVDFEPSKTGKFVDSEQGLIPKGWRIGEFSEICDIVGGGTPSKSRTDFYCKNGIAWLTPKDLSVSKAKFTAKGAEDITLEGYNSSSAKLMPRGAVLFSSRAPIGYITIAKNEISTNQGFKSAVPRIAGTGYLYYYLKSNISTIESKASGSTFKEASGALMKSLKVIVPPTQILNDFEKEIDALFRKQELLDDEIINLAIMRDTLLPKLMSGEPTINEIDC